MKICEVFSAELSDEYKVSLRTYGDWGSIY